MKGDYKILNQKQLRAIHALLGDHGLRDDKASIVQAFTGGRTTHSSEMSIREAAALIGHLKSLNPINGRADKMRNKILSMAHEMGWTVPSSGLQPPSPHGEGKQKVDMAHVNNWCLAKSYLKKKLDDYEYAELPKLVTQFEQVYKSHLKNNL